MTTPNQPRRYVMRPNEQTFAPPYIQAGCALHGFALPAERARMQRVVDRFLAEPTRGKLRPQVAADHVLLYWCDFDRSHSLDPDDAQRGWLGERECGLWIPIRMPESSAPSFFVHAMFVDSGPAMCSGREVLGFPKEIGLVGVSRDPDRASTLALDVLAMGEGRTQAGAWRSLIELERLESNASVPSPWSDLASLLGTQAQGEEGVVQTGIRAAIRASAARAEFVNLKQFRSAADSTRACYQAVLRTRARVLGLHRISATAAYAYRIHALASHPLCEELGLPASGRTRGVFCEFDFDLDHLDSQELA